MLFEKNFGKSLTIRIGEAKMEFVCQNSKSIYQKSESQENVKR